MLIVSLSQVYSIQLVPNEITDYWRRSSLRLWVRTCQEWLFRNFLLYFLPWPLLLLVPPEWMCWSCQGPFWYHCWHVFSWLQNRQKSCENKFEMLMHYCVAYVLHSIPFDWLCWQRHRRDSILASLPQQRQHNKDLKRRTVKIVELRKLMWFFLLGR